MNAVQNMNCLTADHCPSTTTAWRLWLTVFILGGVFFFVSHDWNNSLYEDFAPWSNASEVQASGGNAIKGAAMALIGLLGMYFLLQKDGRPWNWRNPLAVLMVFYLLWAGCSLAWSIDPSMTLRRLAVLSLCFVGALGIARLMPGRDIVLMAMIITSAYLALGVAAEISHATFRPWESGYRFSGTVHPNTQGAFMSILSLAAMQLARTENNPARRRWIIVLGVIGFVFLLLSRSRTSLVGLLAAVTAIGMLRARTSTKTLAVCGALGMLCGALLLCSMAGIDVEHQFVSTAMAGRDGESETLTGRLPVWNEMLYYANQRPWQGFGYESFWMPQHIEDVSEDLHWRLREAHNAYLDAVLSIGIVGAATLLMIVLLGIYRTSAAYRAEGDPCSGFTLAMLVFGLLSAMLESGMAATNFITLITSCGLIQTAFFRNQIEK